MSTGFGNGADDGGAIFAFEATQLVFETLQSLRGHWTLLHYKILRKAYRKIGNSQTI